jgi:hypothetical protein
MFSNLSIFLLKKVSAEINSSYRSILRYRRNSSRSLKYLSLDFVVGEVCLTDCVETYRLNSREVAGRSFSLLVVVGVVTGLARVVFG